MNKSTKKQCRCKNHKLECDGYDDVPAKIMFVGLSAGKLGALIITVPLPSGKQVCTPSIVPR